jgi:branched-chain amino acid aminotransferase
MSIATSSNKAKDWIVFSDGQFKPLSEVTFFSNTQALNYGTGTFEGIRAYWSADHQQLNLFRAADHYDRFIASAGTLRINPSYTSDQLVEITQELIKRNDFHQDIYIRPLLLKKSLMPGEKFGVKLAGVDSTLCISALPMGSYVMSEYFKCIVSKWQRISNSAIPSIAKITGSYVNSALAYEDARDHGADDAIMLNDKGLCAEATTSNVFIVKNGSVLTPHLAAGILNGITRNCIIDICKFLGIRCVETQISVQDLHSADQCFLTGTGIEVTLVSELSGKIFVNHKDSVAHVISNLYNNIVRGHEEQFSKWLRPIY